MSTIYPTRASYDPDLSIGDRFATNSAPYPIHIGKVSPVLTVWFSDGTELRMEGGQTTEIAAKLFHWLKGMPHNIQEGWRWSVIFWTS